MHHRLVNRETAPYDRIKFELWRAAGYAVHQRRRHRKAAAALLRVARDAWLQRDDPLRFERCLHMARTLILIDTFRPVVDVALAVAAQRRKAACAPRSRVNGDGERRDRVPDDRFAECCARMEKQHGDGWVKFAAGEMEMDESTVRRRFRKMQA